MVPVSSLLASSELHLPPPLSAPSLSLTHIYFSRCLCWPVQIGTKRMPLTIALCLPVCSMIHSPYGGPRFSSRCRLLRAALVPLLYVLASAGREAEQQWTRVRVAADYRQHTDNCCPSFLRGGRTQGGVGHDHIERRESWCAPDEIADWKRDKKKNRLLCTAVDANWLSELRCVASCTGERCRLEGWTAPA